MPLEWFWLQENIWMWWENVDTAFRFLMIILLLYGSIFFFWANKIIFSFLVALTCPLTSRLSWQVPVSENSKLISFGSNHNYLECIKTAYEFASGELLNLIKEKVRVQFTQLNTMAHFHPYLCYFLFVSVTLIEVALFCSNKSLFIGLSFFWCSMT